jgi:hypothetical protein
MPGYAIPDAALIAECEISNSSTHSPGGQHRNKTESSVRFRHRPSGLVAQCEEHRDRADNRAEALRRLRLRLAIQQRGASDPAWLQPFRRGNGLALRPEDPGFVLAVACCLDALAAAQAVIGDAARALALSTSQFTKLLTADKEVLHAANELRKAAGLRPLRPNPAGG